MAYCWIASSMLCQFSAFSCFRSIPPHTIKSKFHPPPASPKIPQNPQHNQFYSHTHYPHTSLNQTPQTHAPPTRASSALKS